MIILVIKFPILLIFLQQVLSPSQLHILMLEIVIFDARVSLIPKKWHKHPRIRSYIAKKGRIPILNGSLHQHMQKHIPLEQRMDRPDILHFSLLLSLDLARIAPFEVKIYFTIKETVYSIDNSTRLPRSQERFYSILEQILNGQYSRGLIRKMPHSLHQYLSSNVLVFSRVGSQKYSKQLIDIDNGTSFVFGGMAHGSIPQNAFPNCRFVSLHEKSLEAWTAIAMAVSPLLV